MSSVILSGRDTEGFDGNISMVTEYWAWTQRYSQVGIQRH